MAASASFFCRFGGVNNVQIPPKRCSPIHRHVRSTKTTTSAVSTARLTGSRSAIPLRRYYGDKLDEWVRDSVAEIVKNLREAPLMVHVYGEGAVVEKAAVDWKAAKGRWEAGESPVPEGLIFVEELNDSKDDEGVTRAFGVVVQGKGVETWPVCYLLKTSTTWSGSGSRSVRDIGFGCTHFCLVRVTGFRETTESQLKNCWLL